jgi:hypothetical protein
MSNENWMEPYQDRKLGDLHLPGSHDAGTIAEHVGFTLGGTASNAVTQDLTIGNQLIAGTRFFDLRLAEHGGQVVAHHTTAGQGAYGTTSFGHILLEAAEFCKAHPTEVAIFRISHTSASTAAHEIEYASHLGTLCTAAGNLCEKTLTEIKAHNALGRGGGLICIFDTKKFGKMINQHTGIHSFSKYSSVPSNPHGISTCGCFSATHKIRKVIQNGLKGQYEHCTSHEGSGSHLWQVYWQKTYMNPVSRTGIQSGTTKDHYRVGTSNVHGILDPMKAHGGTHAATDHMIKLMEGHSPSLEDGEDYAVGEEKVPGRFYGKRKKKIMHSTLAGRNFLLPNIISYDFVNKDVNDKIIALNTHTVQPTIIDDEDDDLEWV